MYIVIIEVFATLYQSEAMRCIPARILGANVVATPAITMRQLDHSLRPHFSARRTQPNNAVNTGTVLQSSENSDNGRRVLPMLNVTNFTQKIKDTPKVSSIRTLPKLQQNRDSMKFSFPGLRPNPASRARAFTTKSFHNVARIEASSVSHDTLLVLRSEVEKERNQVDTGEGTAQTTDLKRFQSFDFADRQTAQAEE